MSLIKLGFISRSDIDRPVIIHIDGIAVKHLLRRHTVRNKRIVVLAECREPISLAVRVGISPIGIGAHIGNGITTGFHSHSGRLRVRIIGITEYLTA